MAGFFGSLNSRTAFCFLMSPLPNTEKRVFVSGGTNLHVFGAASNSFSCQRRRSQLGFVPTATIAMHGGRLRHIGRTIAVAIALVFGSLLPVRGGVAYAKQRVAEGEEGTKSLRYDGRNELSAADRLISLGITGGALVGLMAWAYRKNRKDDELELVRVRNEVERLEKLRAEFLDVDEDGEVDDEELLADLNKRLGKTDAQAQEGDEKKGDGSGTGSTAVADSEDTAGGGQIETDQDARDMLKRMYDASEEDKKDKDKKDKDKKDKDKKNK